MDQNAELLLINQKKTNKNSKNEISATYCRAEKIQTNSES
jgi:hypothetical protein